MRTFMLIPCAVLIGFAIAMTTVQPAAAQELPAPSPASPDFYPSKYLGQGDAFNCVNFASQADAQAVLRAEPSDPNKLDQGGIPGVACESNRAPKDLLPALP
jgi:hypothetical protein